jgi:hypothetical protein
MATKSSTKTTKNKQENNSMLLLFGITLILLGILLVVNLIYSSATSASVMGASTINRPTTVNQELRSIEHMLRDIDQADVEELE